MENRLTLSLWLLEVSISFDWTRKVLQSALDYLDMFTSSNLNSILLKNYQLLGCCCLWISAKFHMPHTEVDVITLRQLCKQLYTTKEFIKEQIKILKGIQCQLSIPPLCDRIESFALLSKKTALETETLQRFGDQWCLDPHKHKLGHFEALKIVQSEQTKLLREFEIALTGDNSDLPHYEMTALVRVPAWI
jgi:hypothetical protein